VTLIPPPGKAIKVKNPDALVYPVPAQHNDLLLFGGSPRLLLQHPFRQQRRPRLFPDGPVDREILVLLIVFVKSNAPCESGDPKCRSRIASVRSDAVVVTSLSAPPHRGAFSFVPLKS
jgi:hypothetical protein